MAFFTVDKNPTPAPEVNIKGRLYFLYWLVKRKS